MTALKLFFLVTNLNRDKTHLNGTASPAFLRLDVSGVGLRVTPVIKISRTRLAIRPHSRSLITLPDSKHLD